MVIIPFFELVQLPKHKHYKEMQNIYILVKRRMMKTVKNIYLLMQKTTQTKNYPQSEYSKFEQIAS